MLGAARSVDSEQVLPWGHLLFVKCRFFHPVSTSSFIRYRAPLRHFV